MFTFLVLIYRKQKNKNINFHNINTYYERKEIFAQKNT